jgi:hypothetical protein
MYGVTTKTFTAWIRPHLETIGRNTGKLFNPAQVSRIFDILGPPPDDED